MRTGYGLAMAVAGLLGKDTGTAERCAPCDAPD